MSSKEGKSKAQLKAERRAKQEAERATKESKKQGGGVSTSAQSQPNLNSQQPSNKHPPQPQSSQSQQQHGHDRVKSSGEQVKKDKKGGGKSENVKSLEATLGNLKLDPNSTATVGQDVTVHPAFLRLGLQYSQGTLRGSDTLCVALIQSFKEFVIDYERPADKAFGRDIETAIRPHVSFLSGGRPLPPALGNLVKQLKARMTSLPDTISDQQAKDTLTEWLEDFLETKISLAFEAISMYAREKLRGGIVVLVYQWSPLVEKILVDVAKEGEKLSVIVVDSLPEQSGRQLVKTLTETEVQVSYLLINAIGYIIRQCELVILNAESLLGNGDALAPVGSGQIALAANTHNIPLLAVCPTYKFQEKVSTFQSDVTAASEPLISKIWDASSATQHESMEIIPSSLMSGVVTELRILPPSSAPAVLRVTQMAS